MITIEGITYREIPFPEGEDTPCKECQYYKDNGKCNLEKCPTLDNRILANINEKHFYELHTSVKFMNYLDKLE